MAYSGEGGLPDLRKRAPKQRGIVTLNASGVATIEFNPPIERPADPSWEPFMQYSARIANAGDDKVLVNVVDGTFTTNGSGSYTGVTIAGARVRSALPTLTPLSVGALLSGVITGVNAIVTALTGLQLVRSDNVTGVRVDWQVS